jgi:hypothetical protein
MTAIVTRRRAMPGLGACVLGLALLASGCVGDTSMSASSDDLFDAYDDDGDGMLGPAEWDQVHINLDRDGDGGVSREEFDAGLGGGDRR